MPKGTISAKPYIVNDEPQTNERVFATFQYVKEGAVVSFEWFCPVMKSVQEKGKVINRVEANEGSIILLLVQVTRHKSMELRAYRNPYSFGAEGYPLTRINVHEKTDADDQT